ncbi:TRAP transporter substrate-binding protein [Gammaproteobacteria bacterium]|nr:TRAP transporter substrate-binding protein [Gammaproteobacteria bacterium]
MNYPLRPQSLALATLLVGVTAGATETWDMPMAYADSNFHTEGGKAFAECVNAATDEVEIVVHGGGSLFGGGDIKRAVQTGQAPIGERLLSAHANEEALFGFDSVPFVATSYAEAAKLWQAAKPSLSSLLDSQNLVMLYSAPWPPQGIYSKQPIETIKDMEGVKFRAYNAATARIAELMKAVPVQIEAAELSQALATGVAESFVSSGSTGYDRKVWEQLDYWYEVNAWLPRNTVFANKQAWDGLSDAGRDALSGCATQAEAKVTAKSEELNEWYKEQLVANGMTVAPASVGFAMELRAIGKTMGDEWLQDTGETGQTILDAFRQ